MAQIIYIRQMAHTLDDSRDLSTTDDSIYLNDDDQHDYKLKTKVASQWGPARAEMTHWWRRWKLVRRVRMIEVPASGIRITREEWDDRSAGEWRISRR